MYKPPIRFLAALLLVVLLCSTAQATNLLITVQDNLDATPIPQATVYQGSSVVGRTTASGTFLLAHDSTEDLYLRVTKSGYLDWEGIVDMDATSLLVNLTKEAVVLNVRLYDSDSLSPVADADVDLTPASQTVTKKPDANGFASFPFTAYPLYDPMTNAENYQTQASRTVEIGTVDKEVQYWLMRNDRFSFVVSDTDNNPVEGAAIYLDSELKGSTDSRGILFLQVERDEPYVIEVKKDGYQDYKERRRISGDDALISIEISKVPVGAFVTVYDEQQSPVEGATVYLDNVVAGTTDGSGKYVFEDLTSGVYQMEIQKEGYETVRQTISVEKQGDEFTADLQYSQAELTVFVQSRDQKVISGARVFVNGNDLGTSGDNGQVTTNVKYNTQYNITAMKDGYQTRSVVNTVIVGNETSSVTLILEKNLDWGFIGLVGVGAVVLLLVLFLIRHRSRKPGRHVIRRDEI